MLLRGGRVIDPSSGLDDECDVLIEDGRIAEIGRDLDGQEAFDCTGFLVVPGLIDLHVHGYQYATPLGIDVDHYCLGRGVTTAVDAGSAGASTLLGLRKYVIEKCSTRLLAFLNIAQHGLASAGCVQAGRGGELDSLNQVSTDACIDGISSNRDIVVGVKIRLAEDVADGGRNEVEAYRRAILAARNCGVPIMTHHAFSSIPVTGQSSEVLSCPGSLARGDIYTHCFHGFSSCIVDPHTGHIDSGVWEAKQRGVLFDIGHGMGSFNWTVAEICAKSGFWPDTVSTDLHTDSQAGPAYDLPTVMSKMLCVGMPLNEILRSVTSTPAFAIGWQDRIGSLKVGREADVTVLSLESCHLYIEDCQAQQRLLKQKFVPKAVWRAGRRGFLTEPEVLPNQDRVPELAKSWTNAVVRDAIAPITVTEDK
ncbi:deacetylase Oant_2987-like [Corticium candelabrum]|uniref:deacetylase Oant_2987-like n=1 Tax=Corticium candelabrum TaxID=121492 RepID=UPI002E2645F1|nr:deacetylase Oant_2987-like [Corticium candelabrum]